MGAKQAEKRELNMKNKFRTVVIFNFLLIAMMFALVADAAFGRKSVEKQRAEVLEMREETLARFVPGEAVR